MSFSSSSFLSSQSCGSTRLFGTKGFLVFLSAYIFFMDSRMLGFFSSTPNAAIVDKQTMSSPTRAATAANLLQEEENDKNVGLRTEPLQGFLEFKHDPRSEPMNAFLEWKKYHDVDSFNAADHEANKGRKFILGTYGCPDMTGNLVHELTISLMFAIITNRTLVWDFDNDLLKNSNTEKDCNNYIRIRSWMPRNARRKFSLPRNKRARGAAIDPDAPGGRYVPTNETEAMANHPYVHSYHIWETISESVAEDAIWPVGDVILTDERSFNITSQLFAFENDLHARQVVQALFANGYHYLMGMLRDASFIFKDELVRSVDPYKLPETPEARGDMLTFGIHSRHIRIENDGSDVTQEVNCMDMLLNEQRQYPDQPCKFLIMADREATLQNLTAAANERNCDAVVVEHDEIIGESTHKDKETNIAENEHGPYRGRGFFRDWLVVKQATSGFIHFQGRSSSSIVYEHMVYDAMTQGFVDKPIPRCSMQWKIGRKSERLIVHGKETVESLGIEAGEDET